MLASLLTCASNAFALVIALLKSPRNDKSYNYRNLNQHTRQAGNRKTTYSISSSRKLAEEKETAILTTVVGNDILNSGVPSVTERDYTRLGGGANRPEVMGKSKHRPVILNSAEVRVLSVWQTSVVEELSADGNVGAGLKRGASNLERPLVIRVRVKSGNVDDTYIGGCVVRGTLCETSSQSVMKSSSRNEKDIR